MAITQCLLTLIRIKLLHSTISLSVSRGGRHSLRRDVLTEIARFMTAALGYGLDIPAVNGVSPKNSGAAAFANGIAGRSTEVHIAFHRNTSTFASTFMAKKCHTHICVSARDAERGQRHDANNFRAIAAKALAARLSLVRLADATSNWDDRSSREIARPLTSAEFPVISDQIDGLQDDPHNGSARTLAVTPRDKAVSSLDFVVKTIGESEITELSSR